MTGASTIALSLRTMRAGRPAAAWAISRSTSAEEPRPQAVRRDEQPAERPLARQAGEDVEQVGDVGADLGRGRSAGRGPRTGARSSGCSCPSRCGRSGAGRSPRAGRRARSCECVLSPTRPYTTWAPARSSLRAQTMLASSSKRALISTRTTTCLPRSAARMSDCTIGESPDVRYSVCLIVRTSGSSAAWVMNRSTDAANDSYGWWTRMSPARMAAKTSAGSSSSGGTRRGGVDRGPRRGAAGRADRARRCATAR